MIVRSSKFDPLYETKKRYILITGGRGSGKSFEVATFATLLSHYPKHRILYTRYTMTSAELSIIPEFKEKIELLEVSNNFDVGATEIRNRVSGSDIIFKGIKTSQGIQTAALKSLNAITTWVLEEGEEMQDEDEFDKIDLSIRSQRQNRIIILLNPTTIEHWIWQRWFKKSNCYIEIDGCQVPISTHPDVEHIHTTYLDNLKNLPKDFVDRLRQIKIESPEKYRHVVIGGWLDKAEGIIFENWKEGEFDTSLPYNYGQDYGFFPDPTVLIKVAVDNRFKIIYADEIYYETKLSFEDIEKMNKRNTKPNDLIIADSAEQRLINDLRAKDLNIFPIKKYPNCVIDRIRKMQGYKIIVTERSHNIKRELNNYVWKEKRSSTPIDDFDHALQAISYAADEKLCLDL